MKDSENHFKRIVWKDFKNEKLTWKLGDDFLVAWSDGVFIFVDIKGETFGFPIEQARHVVLAD